MNASGGRSVYRLCATLVIWVVAGCTASCTPQPPSPAQAPPTAAPPDIEPASERRVRDLLEQKISEVRIDNDRFERAIELLQRKIDCDVAVRWDALENIGVTPETPVSVRLVSVKAGKALAVILSTVSTPAGVLSYHVTGDQIIVAPKADLDRETCTIRVYDINDLLPQGATSAKPEAQVTKPTTKPSLQVRVEPLPTAGVAEQVREIISLLQDVVEPDSWTAAGGEIGVIRWVGGHLVISQTRDNHRLLEPLLSQIRRTKQLPVSIDVQLIRCTEPQLAEVLKKWNKTAPAGMPAESTRAGVPVMSGPSRFRHEGPTSTPTLLKAAEVEQLLRELERVETVSVLRAPQVTCVSGQSVQVFYDDRQSDSEAVHTQSGLSMHLLPSVSADRQYVSLTLDGTCSSGRLFEARPQAGDVREQKPQVQLRPRQTAQFSQASSIPERQSILLGGLADPATTPGGSQRLYILIGATVAE